ncbi:hypothetical protein [Gallaecimonas xiamenensis]|uniref:Uncharacterized protein n=1 Tax=Gallaecimonas xiamenensis 3-C-1 TaxID=745411 RepID=K2JTH9_9GAMM|nr:hypothetical protein [Gallaecimonas xiamenensis]EKE77837.1 hypothetical protein B3C1_00215 [Gallaecimonas xiamenensis 3-C-1]
MTDMASCPLKWAYPCPLRWQDLPEGTQPGVRHCPQCRQDVFLVHSQAELEANSSRSRCVALDPGPKSNIIMGRFKD